MSSSFLRDFYRRYYEKTFYRRLHYESEIKYFGKDANKIGMAVEQFIIYNWSVNS